jgi:hypothetical protein
MSFACVDTKVVLKKGTGMSFFHVTVHYNASCVVLRWSTVHLFGVPCPCYVQTIFLDRSDMRPGANQLPWNEVTLPQLAID